MVDIADGDACPVAAVHPQLAQNVRGTLLIELQRLHIQVNCIGMVVHGQKLFWQAAAVEVPGLLEDIIQCRPGFLVGDIVGE
ncbi:hypothetical protein D3C71_2026470 [compost metagenome]